MYRFFLQFRLFVLFVLLVCKICSAQVDTGKLDSLRRSIDSSARAMRVQQEKIVHHQSIKARQGGNEKKLVQEEAKQKEKQEGKETKLLYTGISIGIAFLIVLIVVVHRRRRKSD